MSKTAPQQPPELIAFDAFYADPVPSQPGAAPGGSPGSAFGQGGSAAAPAYLTVLVNKAANQVARIRLPYPVKSLSMLNLSQDLFYASLTPGKPLDPSNGVFDVVLGPNTQFGGPVGGIQEVDVYFVDNGSPGSLPFAILTISPNPGDVARWNEAPVPQAAPPTALATRDTTASGNYAAASTDTVIDLAKPSQQVIIWNRDSTNDLYVEFGQATAKGNPDLVLKPGETITLGVSVSSVHYQGGAMQLEVWS